MIPSPNHLNKNIFASVYLETTGPLVGFHDIFRICIIPLDNFYKPVQGIMPFLVSFKPDHEDSPWLGKEKYAKVMATGVHPSLAGNVLSMWAARLPKQKDKKLVAIAHDWPWASAFMKQLFGSDIFDEVFFPIGRDLSTVTGYINDCCSMNVEEVPFPKLGFVSMCNRLNVLVDEPHDSLNMCRATGNAYAATLRRMFKNTVL